MSDSTFDQLNGVLPSQWIESAICDGIIGSDSPIAPGQIQPNSLDLRLGPTGYRVQCSFLPGKDGFENKLSRLKWYDVPLVEGGTVLESDHVYIFPLAERLRLPSHVYGRTNPKSSTGRLDVFTRIVTSNGATFDEVPQGYEGQLYLEVVPRSFAVKVRPGDSLTQIRFQVGDPFLSVAETRQLLDETDIVLDADGWPLRAQDVRAGAGVVLSVSLPTKDERKVGYRAKKNTAPIDLRAIGQTRVRHYWDLLYGDRTGVILEPDDFYIFASRELVCLPPQYCAEMVPFDPSSGEVRTHYAGFFDSGFGYAQGRAASATAAAVVLEVRSRDVPFLIEDRQPLFRVNILRNTEPPAQLYGADRTSHYQSQRLRLSKQFLQTSDEDEEPLATLQRRLDFADE